jgi:RNA ligase (TIGR02306 family)
VVYFEIDSFLPLDDPRFTFLAPRGARKNPEGVEGHVLKTAKMRGIYSQGLVLPLSEFLGDFAGHYDRVYAGGNVTDLIPGLEKWDPPVPAELAGSAKGPFPSAFRKTDEERVQNMPFVFESYPELNGGWLATEKIDGSSMTVYLKGGEVGVASRNWDIEETSHNSMWKLAYDLELFDYLRGSTVDGSEVAVQGEIFGPGIQGNPLQVKDVQFRIFTIQVNREDLPRGMWPHWAMDLAVPVHNLPYPGTIEEALAQVENLPSLINPQRPVEGIVWRNIRASRFPNGARASWKAISQRYLLKHDR